MFPTRHYPRRSALVGLIASLLLLVLGVGFGLRQRGAAAAYMIALDAVPTALTIDSSTDRAFVTTNNATLSILDLAHDRLVRTIALGSGDAFPSLSLALDPQTHHLFVANRMDDATRSSVYMLDSRSGALLAAVRVGNEAGALAVDTRHGRVFVANEGDNTVSVLDARSGALLHTSAVALPPAALTVDERTARVFVISWGTLPHYMGGRGAASLLDSRTGAFLKTVLVGNAPSAIASDPASGRVFVVNSGDDAVSVLDARNGTVLRTVTVGSDPVALAVDARRARVFVVNAGDATISVLNARTYTVLHTIDLDPGANPLIADPYSLALDATHDRIYAAAWARLDAAGVFHGTGTLFALNTRSGVVRRRIAVGVAPQAIAVDEHSGRVIVANGGGLVRAPDGWQQSMARLMKRWLPLLSHSGMQPPATYRLPSSVSLINPRA